jgi:hypothetical protein
MEPIPVSRHKSFPPIEYILTERYIEAFVRTETGAVRTGRIVPTVGGFGRFLRITVSRETG